MRAIGFEAYGDSTVLKSMEFPDPFVGPHDVLINVSACGVNRVDLDIRSGVSRLPISLPHVLGLEPVGFVARTGPEVSEFRPGEPVAVLHQISCGTCRFCIRYQENLCSNPSLFGVHRQGGYATQVVAPARAVIALPEGADINAVAAGQTTVSTAWHALRARAHLTPGQTVLVNAAGSGVGTAGVQVARLLGGRVIASAGSEVKLANARKMGAFATVNYRTEMLATRALEITDGVGVDVILECVGGEILEQSMKALAPNGVVVTVGAHAGEIVPTDIITLFRNQSALIGSVRATEAEIRHAVDLVARGIVVPAVAAVMPMEDAAKAHDMLEQRSANGRIVLTNGR